VAIAPAYVARVKRFFLAGAPFIPLGALALVGLLLMVPRIPDSTPLAAPAPPDAVGGPAAADADPQRPAESTQSDAPAQMPADADAESAPVLPLVRDAISWDSQIKAMTDRTDVTDTEKARALVRMMPSLPEEVLGRAAEEAASRIADRDYEAILRPTVVNPETHGRAMAALFADLMERPDEITLPTLLTIARNPAHPHASSASDNLRLLLGHDFGTDWPKWADAISRHLSGQR
jgi:hypothetical protein